MLTKLVRWFRRPSDPSGYLYYARLKTSQGKYYKLGFTSKHSLVERMSYAGKGDERLIEKELLFSFSRDAYDVEQSLHDHFRGQRAFKRRFSNDPSMPLAGRGQTELFRHDVLGLDDDLYKATPQQLSKEASAALQEQETGCLLMVVALGLAPFTLGLSLLLLVMGSSAFFGQGSTLGTAETDAYIRPAHPPAIHALIEELKMGCRLTRRPVTFGNAGGADDVRS